jgi:hypothetical protein
MTSKKKWLRMAAEQSELYRAPRFSYRSRSSCSRAVQGISRGLLSKENYSPCGGRRRPVLWPIGPSQKGHHAVVGGLVPDLSDTNDDSY